MKRFLTFSRLLLLLPLFAATASADDNLTDQTTGLNFTVNDDESTATICATEYTSETLTIPETVSSDGEKTYAVTQIAEKAFSENSTITTLTIPEGITSIGDEAFSKCEKITSIVFNAENCTSAKHAFAECNALDTLTFGESVKTIPAFAFTGADSQEDYYEDGNINGSLIESLNTFPNLKTIEIPNNVETVGDYAFSMCSGLTTLTIGTGVGEIGWDAFADCQNLETVNYNAVECTHEGYIHSGDVSCIFWHDKSLKDFNIGDSVVSIPEQLFDGKWCEGFPEFKELTIPSGVESIGQMAFMGCSGLETVNFYATDCTTTVISTGDNKTSGTVFNSSDSITTVKFGEDVTKIPDYLFDGNESSYFPNLTTITIPEKVTYIGTDAFSECKSLKTVYFNATNCSSDGYYGNEKDSNIFFDDSNIEEFIIGDKVESIPQHLLACGWFDISKLTELIIPESVDSIGSQAFYNLLGLELVECEGSDPAECASDAFGWNTSGTYQGPRDHDCWLVVPEDAAANYTNNKTFQATEATKTGWDAFDYMREASVTVDFAAVMEGYATRYSPYEYTLESGMEGAIITTVGSDGALTLVTKYSGSGKNNVVPAGTALLISSSSSAGSSVTLPTQNTSLQTMSDTNLLYGSTDVNENDKITTTAPDDGDYYFYKLTTKNGVTPGFYWGAEGGVAFDITKNRAWLVLDKNRTASEAATTGFILSEMTTGIDIVETNASGTAGNGVIFNLAGQRVNEMVRGGIYIVDGKKVAKQ